VLVGTYPIKQIKTQFSEIRDPGRDSKKKFNKKKTDCITNAGRHSVACFLRTEKPPWVLVSEAVKTLQNE